VIFKLFSRKTINSRK